MTRPVEDLQATLLSFVSPVLNQGGMCQLKKSRQLPIREHLELTGYREIY
jgi:hypothetical protein